MVEEKKQATMADPLTWLMERKEESLLLGLGLLGVTFLITGIIISGFLR